MSSSSSSSTSSSAGSSSSGNTESSTSSTSCGLKRPLDDHPRSSQSSSQPSSDHNPMHVGMSQKRPQHSALREPCNTGSEYSGDGSRQNFRFFGVEAHPSNRQLHVGGISGEVKREHLEDLFSKYGKLDDVWVASNPPGFAYVSFESGYSVTQAWNLDGEDFMGCKLRISPSIQDILVTNDRAIGKAVTEKRIKKKFPLGTYQHIVDVGWDYNSEADKDAKQIVLVKPHHTQRKRKRPKSKEFVLSSEDDSDFEYKSTSRKTVQRDVSKMNLKHKCNSCSYSTNDKSNLKRHMQIHGKISRSTFMCPEGRCGMAFKSLAEIDSHLETTHSKNIEIDNLHFTSVEDFNAWMESLQKKESVKFVCRSSSTAKSKIFYCHRSSQLARPLMNTRKRSMKKIGSIRSERICTSRIKSTNAKDGIRVQYFKSHSGHDIKPGMIGLTKGEKGMLAEQLKQGVPKKKILQNIRSNLSDGVVTRISLTNTQDLVNVAAKFKIDQQVRLDKNDAVSLDATLKLLETNGDHGVFIYKPQGIISDEYPELTADDFVFGYMNEAQEGLLHTFGENIICIDGTHGTNRYGFELTTMLTVDDQHQGFPILFFYHSSKSQATYELLFRKLKERTGIINPKVFMSDDEPSFHNAWAAVMGPVKDKLLCTWHVLRNWHKHLKGLDAGLKVEVSRRLEVLLHELDEFTFKELLQNFLDFAASNDKLKAFGEYLEKYYVHRMKDWAHCYRQHCGINTNMFLERMHRDIKYLYLHAKTARLDESFNAVKFFLSDKQFDRIITMTRSKLTTKDRSTRQRHKTSMEMNPGEVIAMNDHWIVPSFTKKARMKTYIIKQVLVKCSCSLQCPECRVCGHIYQCSCYDNSICSNMCKHTHLLCRFLRKDAEVFPKYIEDDSDQLYIHTTPESEARHNELKSHMKDLCKNSTPDIGMDDVNTIFSSTCGLIRKPEHAKILFESIQRAQALIQASESHHTQLVTPKIMISALSKIEKQPRFIPKKKKVSATVVRESDDDVVARVLLKNKFIPFAAEEDEIRNNEYNHAMRIESHLSTYETRLSNPSSTDTKLDRRNLNEHTEKDDDQDITGFFPEGYDSRDENTNKKDSGAGNLKW